MKEMPEDLLIPSQDSFDFEKMMKLSITAVDNCYNCDCADGEDSGDGTGCDCVACDQSQ
jgi:hypothetical protein